MLTKRIVFMNESVSELGSIWAKVKKNLEEKVEDVRFFDVFLNESRIYSFEKDQMLVAVNSSLAVQVLSNKYYSIISESVKDIVGHSVKITFDVTENLKKVAPVEEDKPIFFKDCRVNTGWTFDTFITGQCNLEAKQAAMYIAANPGKGFNPLFIYSNPGLGKTHLLHAIANYVRTNQPGKKVLYCETGDFIQEVVEYLRGEKQVEELKKFLLSQDILLIDDIQGLATKEKTCYFFFDIFNSLYSHGKQIVITSDKHPSELKGFFEERLKSRFASGLTISISQPDVATCVSILKSKIENGPMDINAFDPRVIEFVAEKFSKNIRDIDQALNKLTFYITTYKPTKYIDMEIAMEALQSLIDVKDAKQKLSEQRIVNVVAEYYNKTPSQITGQSRQGDIALARHVAMYLIRSMLDVPFTRIGMMFGGKDHSTVMNGVSKVENSLKTNTNLQKAISEIKTLLK